MKISITPRWAIQAPSHDTITPAIDATMLIQLLTNIQISGSIASAGRSMGLSYRHVWGLLRDAEQVLGATLITKHPGHGTYLSDLANLLIQADKRIVARLAPTLESLASELEAELRKALPTEGAVLRLCASHGFAVETMLNMMREKDLLVEVRYRNSTEALAALANADCDMAGFHVPVGTFQQQAIEQYMRWLSPGHMLIHLATRRQGLFTARDNPHGINGLKDLTRKDIRFVNRQNGSGTRMLMEMMLKKQRISPHKITGFETAEFTHAAVAAYIASGMADVGFGIETAAHRFGLHFIPLAEERYFFAVRKTALDLSTVQDTLSVLRSGRFQAAVSQLPGYESSGAGTVISVQDAFQLAPDRPKGPKQIA
ncbi:substrate-binding domain-containing protein [Noviherbaspirillum saxi]|uniref:LysR family transcriptional regulator n=1 Tax=Noviherbaspirillum saxi TaxID=2320863 RepID=A0A3A3G3K8_9BURK|nr:substrate-binding domain-containing protein [Noviherbaspirillum saxi]RJF92653.1 LysR family transcriptional regulator [Noviherbaspirillum saxi]